MCLSKWVIAQASMNCEHIIGNMTAVFSRHHGEAGTYKIRVIRIPLSGIDFGVLGVLGTRIRKKGREREHNTEKQMEQKVTLKVSQPDRNARKQVVSHNLFHQICPMFVNAPSCIEFVVKVAVALTTFWRGIGFFTVLSRSQTEKISSSPWVIQVVWRQERP